ncbi:hypothetical protein HF325_005128 [Metschnikowia pulcherrima]|uniref:ER membrane protein complex subunit 1 n=1 Tax=Metschnikowia pulcherrima TaxID=27326 RepID=A0A8H7GPN1_9ASCO|nr:hypothetical protein HF325_005128 [Metschnikowia pulcherrima]
MRAWAILPSLFLTIIFPVSAVSVMDAFKKDWVQYNPGPAVKHALLDHETVLELSQKNILYYKDTNSSKVTGYIDLSLHGSDDFAVGGATIVTYSKNSTLVSIFEKKSGVYISSIQLKAPPVQLQPYADYGWTILQEGAEDGELVTWDGHELHVLGRFYARTFLQYLLPNATYVCADSSAFLLKSGNGSEKADKLTIKNVDYGALFDLLFPPEVVDEIKLTSENRSPIYVTKDIAFSYHNTNLVMYNVSKNTPALIYRKSFDEILDVQAQGLVLAVITRNKAFILDLSEFVKNNKPSEMKILTVKINPQLKLAVLSPGHFTALTGAETLVVSDYNVQTGKTKTLNLTNLLFSATGGSIIVNVPPLLAQIEETHHLVEETRHLRVVSRWLLRLLTQEDVFGFTKILVQVDESRSLVAAKSSQNGNSLWVREFSGKGRISEVRGLAADLYVIFEFAVETLDLRTGELKAFKKFDASIENVYSLAASVAEDDLDEPIPAEVIAVKIGDKLTYLAGEQNVVASQFVLSQSNDLLQAYKVNGTDLRPTWQWSRPNAAILAVSKNNNVMSAGGIARADRSVLYKYLNPNLISIVSEQNNVLTITLLDGVSGTHIYTHEHKDDSANPSSVCITQSDNWIVYSYFETSRSEQRIVVIDLFQNAKDTSGAAKTSFSSANVTASTKTFIYPERIFGLESTTTKFGVTVKSVIALTETGSLVEIPKYLLNSRRIDDRKMSVEDQMDDFRMLPYEPVIQQNTFKVLNHKNKLQLSSDKQQILVLPTDLESTSVVCFANELNDFCTVVQPSSSYDLLKSDFDKKMLLVTIAVLLAAYIFTKPLVEAKKLNSKWID